MKSTVRISWFIHLVLLAFLAAGCASSQPATTEPDPPVQAPAEPTAQVDSVRVDTVYITEAVSPFNVDLDTVRAGRFDSGKMWTFDNPPLDYFAEEYDFRPDAAWFEKAHLGALRIPGCSASFVSPNGLVMTNHHCAREHVVAVSRPGENLLDNGFYATSVDAERPVEDLYADQLIEITDVTDEVYAALEGLSGEERSARRDEMIDTIQARMLEDRGGEEGGYEIEVITLYNGAQYSAYTFRRYNDVRLVMAPELSVGYFGGDPDNFTYPRYNLDVSFLRVYENDAPYQTDHYFEWSENGAEPGEAVFVIGNPGSTNRLQTMAELEFRREYEEPIFLAWLNSRLNLLRAYAEENPEVAQELDLTNTIFGMENQIKAQTGIVEGLNDPVLMTRRRDTEEQFRDALAARPEADEEFGALFDELADLQVQAIDLVPQLIVYIVNPDIQWISTTLNRAVLGFLYSYQLSLGVSEEDLAELRESLLNTPDYPDDLETQLLAARFEDLLELLGETHPTVETILKGDSPQEAAARIVENTAITDSTQFANMLDDFVNQEDPAVELGQVMAIGLVNYQQAAEPINAQQDELSSALGRARFEVYGTDLPPDATFSLRIADGRVKGYSYNGTMAPPVTTYYGLYDRYYAHNGQDPWDLPERWVNPPESFELATPLNLVSTNDIIGGNSGSPMLNTDLEVVGLVFDGNIESLPGEFIYTDELARSIAVDSRGIIEALDDIFDADRLVLELRSGRFAPSEADADEMMPQ